MRATTKCYIEEYQVQGGGLGARLREKGTGRKVDLGVTSDGKRAFLRFLSGAADMRNVLPGLYRLDGDEAYVRVAGDVDFDSPDEIRYIYNDNLEYLVA